MEIGVNLRTRLGRDLCVTVTMAPRARTVTRVFRPITTNHGHAPPLTTRIRARVRTNRHARHTHTHARMYMLNTMCTHKLYECKFKVTVHKCTNYGFTIKIMLTINSASNFLCSNICPRVTTHRVVYQCRRSTDEYVCMYIYTGSSINKYTHAKLQTLICKSDIHFDSSK
jgi:hypothetical protein